MSLMEVAWCLAPIEILNGTTLMVSPLSLLETGFLVRYPLSSYHMTIIKSMQPDAICKLCVMNWYLLEVA